MPVSEFGLAMLQKMGWSEERGIGKNPLGTLIEPVIAEPRHHRLGLGAIPKLPEY